MGKCCVPGCKSYQSKTNVHFHSFPEKFKVKNRNYKSFIINDELVTKPINELNSLVEVRRNAWVQTIKKKFTNKSSIKSAKVCSLHFISGLIIY